MQKVVKMLFDNKLNITNQVALAKAEEKISKQKAKQLFDSGDLERVSVGTFKGLSFIHTYLFENLHHFAGKIRDVNIVPRSGFSEQLAANLVEYRIRFLKSRANTPHVIVPALLSLTLANPFARAHQKIIWKLH